MPPSWEQEAREAPDEETYLAIVEERRAALRWEEVPLERRRAFWAGRMTYQDALRPIAVERPRWRAGEHFTRRGDGALDWALQLLVGTGEGIRNIELNRAAYLLGRVVGQGHLEYDHALRCLRGAGLRLGLPEREVRWVVSHAIREGMRRG